MDGTPEYNEIERIVERVTRDTEIREETNAGIREILRNQREMRTEIKELRAEFRNLDRRQDKRQGVILGMIATIKEGIHGIARQVGYEWGEGRRALDQIDEENRRRLMEQKSSVVSVHAARDAEVEVKIDAEGDVVGGKKDGQNN